MSENKSDVNISRNSLRDKIINVFNGEFDPIISIDYDGCDEDMELHEDYGEYISEVKYPSVYITLIDKDRNEVGKLAMDFSYKQDVEVDEVQNISVSINRDFRRQKIATKLLSTTLKHYSEVYSPPEFRWRYYKTNYQSECLLCSLVDEEKLTEINEGIDDIRTYSFKSKDLKEII